MYGTSDSGYLCSGRKLGIGLNISLGDRNNFIGTDTISDQYKRWDGNLV